MRTGIALALVAVTLVAASPPVDAQLSQFQTTVQVRYWDTGLALGVPPFFSFTDAASGWGLTLRLDSRDSPLSFSARYDSLNVSQFNWPWNHASFWDANVHYRFGSTLNAYAGIFAGYGSFSLGSAFFGFSSSASGFRLGGEFMYRLPPGWYVSGEAAFGPSWLTNGSGFSSGLSTMSITDVRIAAGYEFIGGYGVEAGWRRFATTMPAGGVCFSCSLVFDGLTLAVTFRR